MRFGNQRGKVETEAGASRFACPRRVAAVERLPDMLCLFPAQSGPVIPDREYEIAVRDTNRELDRPV